MKRLLFSAALAALAFSGGCDRMLMPERPAIYAPWEEGLTLGYEDPSQTGDRRLQDRFQVRVKSSRLSLAGRAVVQTTTTLTGQSELNFLLKDGGVSLGMDASSGLRVLPEGFPDRTSRWEDRNVFHWVVGRARVRLPGVRLADPDGDLGVWVESVPVNGAGPRERILYLPDIGEAEALQWRDGRWVPVFRLVSRGFTDLPAGQRSQ
jgi:hypothetical protein